MPMNDPVNKIIMTEIGLTTDDKCRVLDQDTRSPLQYKEKVFKYSSKDNVMMRKGDVCFNPIDDKSMMASLFGHFVQKIDEEGKYVSAFSEIESEDKKSKLELKVNGEKITTGEYNNSSLKFVDAILLLNGTTDINLKVYDSLPEKEKKKSKKK